MGLTASTARSACLSLGRNLRLLSDKLFVVKKSQRVGRQSSAGFHFAAPGIATGLKNELDLSAELRGNGEKLAFEGGRSVDVWSFSSRPFTSHFPSSI